MKKLLAMLLAAMMVLSLVACGNTPSKDPQKPSDTTVNNEQEAPNEVTSDPATTESTVDLSKLKFNTAEEVFVDENGQFYGGLEGNNEEGAVLLDGSGVKIVAKELADSETNEAKLVSLQVENNSGGDLIFQSSTGTINGYMASPALSIEVANGSEAEGIMKFTDKELALLEIDTLAEASFAFRVFATGSFDDYLDTALIRVNTPVEASVKAAYGNTDTVVYDKNDIKIATRGLDREETMEGIRLPIYIENNSDSSITITTKTASINGVDVNVIFTKEVFAGKKAIEPMNFFGSDLVDKQIEKIETADLAFQIIDTATGEVLFETPTVTANY